MAGGDPLLPLGSPSWIWNSGLSNGNIACMIFSHMFKDDALNVIDLSLFGAFYGGRGISVLTSLTKKLKELHK